jgi:hypothetical protein
MIFALTKRKKGASLPEATSPDGDSLEGTNWRLTTGGWRLPATPSKMALLAGEQSRFCRDSPKA